jgi:signal transduction histidine kinase/ActR/RegA family two-component response regulator
MKSTLYSAPIQTEEDVVMVRRKARETAALLGFDMNDQTRIGAAVSEAARDCFTNGGGGATEFAADFENRWFSIRISGQSRSPAELKRQLGSDSPAAIALAGAQRLMDAFDIEPEGRKGSAIVMAKQITVKTHGAHPLEKVAAELAAGAPRSVMEELRQENRELLRVMDELRARQDDLARLNVELEHTNRGVVALYAEIDEKAEKLRRADQMKSRFLSHMSHEFRTPLTSIMALSRLLIDEADGALSPEQRKQAMFIRKSAESLLDMVNELLEMARLEAGKSIVRPTRFTVGELFSALQGVLKPLRGVLRPLNVTSDVELTFEEAPGIPELYTDESKVAQILRNFVSNALKFTEKGKIQVTAELTRDVTSVEFAVSDTGIGIPAGQIEAIFQEFAQVESAVQGKVSGSGLGLPLAKGLAELLGGGVRVESAPGDGSTFYARIPLRYPSAPEMPAEPPIESTPEVLVIDDEEVSRYLVRQALGPSISSIEAASGAAGLEMARSRNPRAIVLDLNMPNMHGLEVLQQLESDASTQSIPVIVLTAQALTRTQLDALNGRVNSVISKEVLSRPDGPMSLRAALAAASAESRKLQ